MRCPKCGFNSFDHNLLCPKCRKDLTATRRLLNLTVPAPGATDFFNTAGQRAAFPEPLLGEELLPDDQPGSMFPAAGALAAGAAASPFSTPPPPADLPFGAPPFPADATIDDIVPLAADVGPVEDIMPLEADDDLDEIVPIETETDIDEIVPIEAGELVDELSPINVAAESTQIVLDPVLGEEEIEIEIDDLVEPIDAVAAPAPAPPEGHQMAMDHIKSTLAETGDLGAPVEVIPELEVATELEISEAPVQNPVPDVIEELDLDGPLIEDIDDSDILEFDDLEENVQSSDTVAVDLDPEDLVPDFFDEVTPEPAALEPVPEISLQLDEAPNLEELAPGDLAGPFWDEQKPPQEAPSNEMEVPSLEELDEAPAQADLSFVSMDDPGIEPEDLALGLETNLSDLDQELTAEEMFAEQIPPQAASPEMPLEPAAEAVDKPPVHPPALPEIPAGVFGSITPEDTLTTPKITSGGNLDADDLSSLADDINLDDLDSEL